MTINNKKLKKYNNKRSKIDDERNHYSLYLISIKYVIKYNNNNK